jgi:hypothetical protein
MPFGAVASNPFVDGECRFFTGVASGATVRVRRSVAITARVVRACGYLGCQSAVQRLVASISTGLASAA